MNFKDTEELIKDSKKILIISHINPDGDALGSTFGLYSAIFDRFKKKCDICTLTYVSPVYKFLPYFELAKQIFDKSLIYDLVITVDVAAIDRIGEMGILFDKAKHTINIDHHKTNNSFGEYNFIDEKASSTGEILFEMFKNSDWEISEKTANCLYTAILTDTGGFRFDNTTSKVFKIISNLCDMGAKPSEIYSLCYESKSKDFVMFQNYCVNKTVFLENDTIAYTKIYRKDYEKFNAREDYTEGLAEIIRGINSVDISFIAKEIDTKTCKISMRSKNYDVSKICMTFGGGGHSKAAGCIIKNDIDIAVGKVLDELRKVRK